MTDIMRTSIAPTRASMLLLALFAGVAMVMAAVGVFGVMSYAVNLRSREMGIRLALGARPAEVRRMVVADGMKQALVGVVVGARRRRWLTRMMASLLFGVSPGDPLTLALASAAAPPHRGAGLLPARAPRDARRSADRAADGVAVAVRGIADRGASSLPKTIREPRSTVHGHTRSSVAGFAREAATAGTSVAATATTQHHRRCAAEHQRIGPRRVEQQRLQPAPPQSRRRSSRRRSPPPRQPPAPRAGSSPITPRGRAPIAMRMAISRRRTRRRARTPRRARLRRHDSASALKSASSAVPRRHGRICRSSSCEYGRTRMNGRSVRLPTTTRRIAGAQRVGVAVDPQQQPRCAAIRIGHERRHRAPARTARSTASAALRCPSAPPIAGACRARRRRRRGTARPADGIGGPVAVSGSNAGSKPMRMHLPIALSPGQTVRAIVSLTTTTGAPRSSAAVKLAALRRSDAEDVEQLRRRRLQEGQLAARRRRLGPAGHADRRHVEARERHRADRRRRRDAGHRAHALERGVEQICRAWRCRAPVRRPRRARRPCCMPKSCGEQVVEAAAEHARAGEQQHRQRRLQHEQARSARAHRLPRRSPKGDVGPAASIPPERW